MAGTRSLMGASALSDELRRSDVVRLRGVPASATEADIVDCFKGLELGPDGAVICLNVQGRPTGHAYVQFASAEGANKALERNRQHTGNLYFGIFKGHPSDMQGALRMTGRGNANASMDGSVVCTGIPGMFGSSDMRYKGVIRLKNIEFGCTSADITAYFKGLQIVPDGIFLCTHADGRPKGEALVEFVNEETAARAMHLNKGRLGQRFVELCHSTKGEMMTAIQQRMHELFTSHGNFSKFGQIPGTKGSFGLPGFAGTNRTAIAIGGMPGPPGPGESSENLCIKMRGLPYNAGFREIMDFFKGYNIAPNGIHIVTGANDCSTGEAFVEFVSPEEARRAMERHRQNIGSRYIELFRASKSEMHLATGGSSGVNNLQPLDASVQLFLFQQQAAAGAFGMGGQGIGVFTEMQNPTVASSSLHQRQTGLAGSAGNASFDPSTPGRMRGAPYGSL
eukprot:c23100_g1_i1 orf=403-1755(-)